MQGRYLDLQPLRQTSCSPPLRLTTEVCGITDAAFEPPANLHGRAGYPGGLQEVVFFQRVASGGVGLTQHGWEHLPDHGVEGLL